MDEIQTDVCEGTGCKFDVALVWTSDACQACSSGRSGRRRTLAPECPSGYTAWYDGCCKALDGCNGVVQFVTKAAVSDWHVLGDIDVAPSIEAEVQNGWYSVQG